MAGRTTPEPALLRRFRIDLAYDGAPYAGFAKQPDQITVQGTLEGALTRATGVAVPTTCAGRTDRGVHALGQVVHLDLDASQDRVARLVGDLRSLRRRLDGMTGEAITIWRVTEVDPAFDARFSALWRRYRFRLGSEPADPRTRSMVWRVPSPLDVETMGEALRAVVGEHDYASFCRRADGGHTRRSIVDVDVNRTSGTEVDVVLRGTAFCHQQVRAIVGSLVEVGTGRRPAAWLGEVLQARDRAVAGPVAPPHGLTLEAVGYPDPWPDAPLGAGPDA